MKGKIKVNTQQLLPIIKKWLYSEKEIFFRELVSNSYDAIVKLKKISISEEVRNPENTNSEIRISIHREKNILTIADNGLGMTKDEIEKYLAQIACSSALDFVKAYENSEKVDQSGIIGSFGLGFYSAFMVADLVEVESLSYRLDNTKAVLWSSDGGEEYTITEGNMKSRGTEVRLHIGASENKEFLDKARIDALVRKFVDFLPVAITVDGAQANKQNPLWTKPPAKTKAEEYLDFYKYLYPLQSQSEPLFQVHLNVDYPFTLQGILYFPRLQHEMEVNKSNVKIYCKQIFVSDQAQEIIPQYLTVLQGVIDIPNLPLNVSRSYLQNEPQIRKISAHIVKKVADRLNEEFSKNRKNYEKTWQELAPFVKYAILNDETFYEQIAENILFRIISNVENADEYVTLQEYQEKNKKSGNKVYYTANEKTHLEQISMLQQNGLQIMVLDTLIDNHFIQFLEYKKSDIQFVRVDAEISEHILDSEKETKIIESSLDKKDTEDLQKLFEKAINSNKVSIQIKAFKNSNQAAMIVVSEKMRRLQEMSTLMAGKNIDQGKEQIQNIEHSLVLNRKHPLIQHLLKAKIIHAKTEQKKQEIARQIYYLARLSQGFLSQSDLRELIAASYATLGHTIDS